MVSAGIIDEIRWSLIQKKTKETKIAMAFKLLREHSIEPILIKGWAAAQNYPSDKPRHFNDIDLAVSTSDYERAEKLSATVDFLSLNLDIHNELRHLDTSSWDDLFENSRLVDIAETVVRILRPEDHFRVLCVHWLTDGGAYKNRLWDIYYAVANRPAAFDWDRCLDRVDQRRRKWIVTTIGVAHKYLGLEIDDLPFASEAKKIPLWIERCLEKEWKSEIRLQPIVSLFGKPKVLVQQIFKRIPPNPIRATIEMEGNLDDGPRWRYQIRSFLRMLPNLSLAAKVIADRNTGRNE